MKSLDLNSLGWLTFTTVAMCWPWLIDSTSEHVTYSTWVLVAWLTIDQIRERVSSTTTTTKDT